MLRGSVPSATSRQAHTFSRAPQAAIPRSKFNRSHGVKTTFNEGYLYPILVDEVLPGDTFNLKLHAFARMNTPIFPIMDNLYMETFFFFVPNRLLWEHWEQFNGFQVNPGDSVDYTVPLIDLPAMGGIATGDLMDYMGVPTKIGGVSVNALHTRAYNLIWNEWFRDENMQDSVVVDVDDGPDTYTDYVLLRRGKRYDYFTSCLPFPQKGPDVALPLGSTANIELNPAMSFPFLQFPEILDSSTGSLISQPNVLASYVSSPGLLGYGTTAATAGATALFDPNGTLVADLADATSATINDLRLAFQTQKLYERDARGGTRYTEIIRSHFGVVSPDMRLQRPEYLGGGSSPVVVNPVAQTTSATTPTERNSLGVLGAYGVCAPHGHGFTYSATEHGVIVGLLNVRADINYQQGLERMWSRQTRFDFYWPAFSHIGEQAVLNQEIYLTATNTDPEVFGYQERYAEYRYKPSQITGVFRSNATGSYDVWHLAQDFGSLPTLNNDFIVENAPMSRIMAVPSEPDFIFDGFFQYHCARPMPVYAIPGLVDHF
nr:MAG: major capsid protein [Microviridae sp.]